MPVQQRIPNITEQHVNETAFLWMLRSQAVNQAHQMWAQLPSWSDEITNHLKGLLLSRDNAWEHALEAAQFNYDY